MSHERLDTPTTDSVVSTVWTAVSDRVGDDLRVVTHYEATDFETRMRPDVRERYTEAEDRSVVDDTIITQLAAGDAETPFETGAFYALIRVYEEAWIVSWTAELPAKSGVIVSIQRDGETATLADVEWCLEYLESEVAPTFEC